MGAFAQQPFEAAVFVLPLLDLGEQGLGDVSAAGFAVFFPGEVMTGVFVPLGTAAGGFAAGAVEEDQTGGQDGTLGLKLGWAGIQGALDECGMGGDIHGRRSFLSV